MTLVCFAVAQEARPFQKLALNDVSVLISGMGRRAERIVREAVQKMRPDCVLTCGFAGGLNPALQPNTVLYSAAEIPSLERKLAQVGVRSARFFCAPHALTRPAEKAEAWIKTGADAVEMESGHICSACRQLGVPSATVRVILDSAHEALPLDFNQVMNSEQQIAPLKMAGAIARNPALVPALLRLGRQSRIAAEALATVLQRALVDR